MNKRSRNRLPGAGNKPAVATWQGPGGPGAKRDGIETYKLAVTK